MEWGVGEERESARQGERGRESGQGGYPDAVTRARTQRDAGTARRSGEAGREKQPHRAAAVTWGRQTRDKEDGM